MMPQPEYFERIRQKAVKRWDQLENDPELAGPWHQLFKQVQSPRHVLSELLQNADDAAATEIFVRIERGQFVFSHNGEDFIEEHFSSLCRFGYSNKRSLHTIGFRGIGFKSVFSLGKRVQLLTPTLSVEFEQSRFTEPKWINCDANHTGATEIHVDISDRLREEELGKNLVEWVKSPLSLLFFKHIRKMKIGDREVCWESLGPGPVPSSEWVALNGNADEPFLLVSSDNEEFTDDALAEIRQERLLSADEGTGFPPCSVEIVLGAKGRLHVVLPTGVETKLPFACNAPFIQDPARLKIKDPETSPTNRWLLQRAGKLAASTMLHWLGQESVSVADRARAYALLPDVNRDDPSIEGMCAAIVEIEFSNQIEKRLFLLADDGELRPSKGSVVIPEQLLEVWSGQQVSSLLDTENRPPLSRYVAFQDRQKLINWQIVDQISKTEVLNILQSKHLPKPETWGALLKLWAFIAPEITGYPRRVNNSRLRIVPVQGKEVLYAADEVIRLGEKRLLQSDDDWEFLASHLLVLNQNWPRFLAEQRRSVEEWTSEGTKTEVAAVLGVLDLIGLNETSEISKVVAKVSAEFFRQTPRNVADCIRLAQIAAKLGATANESFRFVTQDRVLRDTLSVILSGHDGSLDEFLAADWRLNHLLHPGYSGPFTSCTREEWLQWISTGRAGIKGFVPLSRQQSQFWGRHQIEAELGRRGIADPFHYPYSTGQFSIEDWDFDEHHWKHWVTLAQSDSGLWGRLVEYIFSQPDSFWSGATSARALQTATTGRSQQITHEPILPRWVLRLRELPCLPDTRGFFHKPSELLVRTSETEPFIGVEPFVHGRIDREKVRPLLVLLGSRETPTNPSRLLDCLRSLSKAEKPPVLEVEKWYQRLDQMMDSCSTTDLAHIKRAFREEKIILTENFVWTSSNGVFLSSDEEDVPGAEIVRSSIRELALWRKLEIPDRPTAVLAMQWLKSLPSRALLSQNDARRVRALLARYAVQIWDECRHWLSLAGEWAPTSELDYGLTMQSLVAWGHLHEWVKQKTADLQRLSVDILEALPFANIPRLATLIEERFDHAPLLTEAPTRREWLNQLGSDLRRIVMKDELETAYVRTQAADLAVSVWQKAQSLQLIPYIGGIPAGTPKTAEAIWSDRVLYVQDRTLTKLARPVSLELGRAFGSQEIAEAIKFCFERPPEFVSEYMEENFNLIPRWEEPTQEPPVSAASVIVTTQDSDVPEFLPPAIEERVDGSLAVAEQATAQHLATNPLLRSDQSDEIDNAPDILEVRRERHQFKPAKLSMLERFALTQGFLKDGMDRYYHADGSSISKATGSRFWERRTSRGEVLMRYWAVDHCLEKAPLQIEADVWGLFDKFPDTTALILSGVQDDPVELAGTQLQAKKDSGEIKLYPATYRLVHDPNVAASTRTSADLTQRPENHRERS